MLSPNPEEAPVMTTSSLRPALSAPKTFGNSFASGGYNFLVGASTAFSSVLVQYDSAPARKDGELTMEIEARRTPCSIGMNPNTGESAHASVT